MLLRNLDQTQGLCNGTRLIITRLAKHVIAAEIISGKNSGHMVYIPRMSMSPPQSPWPFKLLRRQFPIMLSYAMTINKSQGQSLSTVGLYFPKPVFSHGQLYVALSRVKTKKGLKILIHDKDQTNMTSTTNVVFKEVFNNLTSVSSPAIYSSFVFEKNNTQTTASMSPDSSSSSSETTMSSNSSSDTIVVPSFYHQQWAPEYPDFVHFSYDGTSYQIRLRQHRQKVYFAEGLNQFRKDLAIYESITIHFLVH
ncbi:hypothetical protein JHK84_052605 [Glycine max]|nr:hypothetical protein JHK86_052567 [Glycine max]KAG5082567.1 hypothetical protein JHK84_052605 [Glycine max]